MSGGISLKALLFGALTLMVCVSTASAHEHNPWLELSTDTRSQLGPLLTYWHQGAMLSDPTFAEWYYKQYCPQNNPAEKHNGQSCADPKGVYAEYRYNSLTLEQRLSVNCVVGKIISTLGSVPHYLGRIAVIGIGGTLEFETNYSEELIKSLKTAGFKDIAGTSFGHEWGLRSTHSGAQLHWFKPKGTTWINAHIDLENPTSWNIVKSVSHYVNDKIQWKLTHSNAKILSLVSNDVCKLGITDLVAVTGKTIEGIPSEFTAILDKDNNGKKSCP
jgi:hypothetical protein